MTSSSGSSGSSGGVIIDPPHNTEEPKKKRCSPALYWIWTWNNYPKDWLDIVDPGFHTSKIQGWIAGEEIAPTTGTPHLQGYMEFANKEKGRPMGLLPKQVNWIAAKGSREENVRYCSKDGKYQSRGTCIPKKKYEINITMRPWQKEIQEVLFKEPDDRSVYWYWKPEGCDGKTTFQKWIFLNFPGVIIVSGKASDMKNGVIEYEEIHKELPQVVLINIPRCQDTDHISWQGIEEIKDMFFFSPKYHGGQVCGPNPHVIIFSNEGPPYHKLSEDRWIVKRIE